jgi:hypothetical protein
MLVYQQWLRGLPPDRQFELRNMDVPQRVETVQRWAAEMRDDSLFALSEEELHRLFQALRGPLADIRRDVARRVEFPGKRRSRPRA